VKSVGLVLGSAIGPEAIAGSARDAELSGFDELWLAEDFFFTGGIAGAAVALGATERIRVGLGVVSAVVRHPALLAMEIATLSRAFPGRFTPGIGLGVPAWMAQMGLLPPSPLAAMREAVGSVRRLLDGETLSEAGGVFAFDRVELTYPQLDRIPLHMGVIGPKMLRLSGALADGSILSVAAGTEYVRWARQRVDEGRSEAGRTVDHRLTVFAIYSVNGDRAEARRAARDTLGFYKAAGGPNALTDVAGITDDLREMLVRGGAELVAAEMPEAWVDDLTVAGTPDEVAEKILRLHNAGADCVALFPTPGDQAADIIRLTSSSVLPRLR
jgi:5,10-methylenetetrahydromethanopterin reductase